MDDARLVLTDHAWAPIAAALADLKSRRGAPPKRGDREFLEALLYLARTGCPWRDLPDRFGAWDAVYNRFRRWLAAGLFLRLFATLPGSALEQARVLLGDSAIVRAHPHAAGAPKKRGAPRRRRWAAAGAASRPRSTSALPTSGRRWPSC
jgi:transposase